MQSVQGKPGAIEVADEQQREQSGHIEQSRHIE